MKRKIMRQNSQVWRSLWLLLLVFMGGVHTASATSVDELSNVYINTSGSKVLLNNANLSFKVLTAASGMSKPGTVSVQAASKASFSGALTIPSVIYINVSTSPTKPIWNRYTVITIPDGAFKDKKGSGITDLFF